MYRTVGTSLVVALVIAGCSGPEGDKTSARVEVADTSGGGAMAGMDHGAMASQGGMQGMDHGSMPGMRMQDGQEASGGMEGMDHSNMPGMQTSSTPQRRTQAMDHANMPGMRDSTEPRQDGMQGMDHGSMGGMQPAPAEGTPASGTDKLMTLVAELVRDPAVQERIRQDSVLRTSWEDPDVRRILLNRP